jgi:hypothetical protein
MLKQLRRHLSYANVTASVALFVALAGGAYATTRLPKNSVGAKQIKKNAVTRTKIKKNAVTASKIKNGSVDGSKVKDDSLTGGDIVESSLGNVPSASTAANASALGGKAPSAYTSNVAIRVKSLTLANNSTAGAGSGGGADDGTVSCAAGEHAIGGGARIDVAENDQYIVTSRPAVGDLGVPTDGGSADGWRGVVGDSGAVPGGSPAEVYAICAR